MNPNICEVADRITKLERRSTEFLDGEMEYSFFEIIASSEKYYAVGIIFDGDSSLAVFGKDHAEAYELYSRIARLEVTPCGLEDVLRDNFMEMKY